jgi:hypothetical protein
MLDDQFNNYTNKCGIIQEQMMLKYYDSSVFFWCKWMCIIREHSAGSHQHYATEGSTLHFLSRWHMYMCVCLGIQLPLQHMGQACHSCLWVASPVCIWTDLSNNVWYKTENLRVCSKIHVLKISPCPEVLVCVVQWQISPHAELLHFTLMTTTQCSQEHLAAIFYSSDLLWTK